MTQAVRYDDRQLSRVLEQVRAIGPRLQRIAKNLGMTVGQVAGVKRRYREQWDAAMQGRQQGSVGASTFGEEMVTKGIGDALELSSKSTTIKTVEDLLVAKGIDRTKYDIERFEVTKNEQPSRNQDTGEIEVTEYFRIWARLKPKGGMQTQDVIETMIRETMQETRRPRVRAHRKRGEVLHKVVIADPHIAKYAWAKSTGQQHWDVDLAVSALHDCSMELLDEGDAYRIPVARRTIVLLGDYWHFDTPAGTTTGGTPLDRDSRLQNMIEKGTDVLLQIIDRSAAAANTDVILVPGNHDVTLSWATQRILQAHYRGDERVTIDSAYTTRKYYRWGGTLLGFTHGDKARKRLPGLMAIEAKEDWAKSVYREFHTGHFHTMEEKVQNIDGVLVRTAPALCPPDDWHAEHGFLGSLRAMESFLYHSDGGLIGSYVSSPDYLVR